MSAEAERLYRLAFGTYFQLPDPMAFRGDARVIAPRRRLYPDGRRRRAGGRRDRRLVHHQQLGQRRRARAGRGSPRSLAPRHRPAVAGAGARDRRAAGTVRIAGLFTFPHSAQHLRLYQDFGFWPRHLTPVLAKPVAGPHRVPGAAALSAGADRAAIVAACRELTESVFAGLDLSREIEAVVEHGLGDTILLFEDAALAGFAVCHTGAGSEGGSQACYIKFALVRSGGDAAGRLRRLVAACEDFARARGVGQIVAGVSTGRHDAYRTMVELGFRMQLAGVTMHRPHAPGYDRPDVFALEDWR